MSLWNNGCHWMSRFCVCVFVWVYFSLIHMSFRLKCDSFEGFVYSFICERIKKTSYGKTKDTNRRIFITYFFSLFAGICQHIAQKWIAAMTHSSLDTDMKWHTLNNNKIDNFIGDWHKKTILPHVEAPLIRTL